MGNDSFHLFSTPTFISGIAATLDLGATLEQYNSSQTPEEADLKAIKNDWKVVGKDIYFALKQYEQEVQSK